MIVKSEKHALNRSLIFELVRVSERAAVAASKMVGQANKEAKADQLAVDAMRSELNELRITGEIAIGEGERDEAPRLYVGEKVGVGKGPKVDIALDPLEGTSLTIQGKPNALSVIAMARRGQILKSPDFYMDKIAVGPGYPEGVINLDDAVKENIGRVAEAKGVPTKEIRVCVLRRPRHDDIVRQTQACGAQVHFIPDGDIAGIIHTTDANTGIDMYMGRGGAPEGVLAAAALRCLGGQMQGRLSVETREQYQRAQRIGIENPHAKIPLEGMVGEDVLFVATGVTDGDLLDGVRREEECFVTHSLALRSVSKTIRRIRSRHLRVHIKKQKQ